MRIDAHQHFWTLSRDDYGWLTPETGSIYRDFAPADLLPHLNAGRIGATILVQAAATLAETEFMLDIADSTDFVAGVVGWIDFEQPDHRSQLERFALNPKFKGVRPMIQDIADVDWMLRTDLDWAFRALIEMDLTFDALGFPRHLDRFLTLLKRYPDLRCVVDHAMKPNIAGDGFEVWAPGFARIAAETSAFCKLSGLATEASPGWSTVALAPYAQHVLKSFGSGRVMWGSDWPVLELAGSYEDWLAAATRMVTDSGFTASEAEGVFGGNAKAFYRIA